MTNLPLTLALFTSTRGHFGRDTYQGTVNDLLRQLPTGWGGLHANVKWEPGLESEVKRDSMSSWLGHRGFHVTTPCKQWKHHDDSHQLGYLEDIALVMENVTTPYYLHMEDDFFLRANVGPLEQHLADAIQLLEDNPSLVQVRFARWANEYERLKGLKAKHGIDAHAVEKDGSIAHSDWSNNPFIARTRDVRAAIRFLFATNLPRHSEHGLGAMMKLLGHPEQPFYTPSPHEIRCRHMGTLPGEEDPLDKPLFST